MATHIHIHVEGEQTARPEGFDTDGVARYAAGMMGLDQGSYVLVNEADRPDRMTRVWSRRPSDRRRPSAAPGIRPAAA